MVKIKKYSLKYLLTPDYMFEKFDDITPEFLESLGIKALLIDIDNTLAPYEQPEPDDRIKGWFRALHAAGISASLISNNHAPRVELFNRSLGLDAYPDSGKPKSKEYCCAWRPTPDRCACGTQAWLDGADSSADKGQNYAIFQIQAHA